MDRRQRVIMCGLVGLAIALWAGAARAQSSGPLEALQFLLGEWEGQDAQGGATGGFTFTPAVQNHVIVRTNYSNTPATASSPASRHDDLMTIYVEGKVVKADYFDNEGHVIRYLVQSTPGEAVFLSEVRPGEPRYRLTYTRVSATTIKGRFDVAPPGRPDQFAAYLSWNARKTR
jgi:hypothetical protein